MACSKYGHSVMSGALPGKKIAVIPLGVDGDVFRPLPDRVEVKRRLIPGGEDAFVVGCVARNQPRKQIPTLIKAFARFAHNKGDVFLWLHMAPQDVGWSLEELLDLHGLSGRSGFTSGLTPAIGLPDERLNEVYNAFDVMALPTAGEGFGLPLLESMAAGVPVLATDCSACAELVSGRGELIRVREFVTGEANIERAIADEGHLAELLERLYRDRELRAEYGRRGREFAETMTWDRCAELWAELLEEVVADGPAARRSAARVSLAQTVGFWPLVSVLLIVRDGPVELLDRCLQSIDEHLTIPSQVIVSRESEDEALGERVNAWRRPRVVVVAGGSKAAGGNGAFELALRAVQARRLVLLDSRDALPPDWSQQTVDAVRDDEAGWEEFVAEATGALEDTPTKRCSLASTEADEGVAC